MNQISQTNDKECEIYNMFLPFLKNYSQRQNIPIEQLSLIYQKKDFAIEIRKYSKMTFDEVEEGAFIMQLFGQQFVNEDGKIIQQMNYERGIQSFYSNQSQIIQAEESGQQLFQVVIKQFEVIGPNQKIKQIAYLGPKLFIQQCCKEFSIPYGQAILFDQKTMKIYTIDSKDNLQECNLKMVHSQDLLNIFSDQQNKINDQKETIDKLQKENKQLKDNLNNLQQAYRNKQQEVVQYKESIKELVQQLVKQEISKKFDNIFYHHIPKFVKEMQQEYQQGCLSLQFDQSEIQIKEDQGVEQFQQSQQVQKSEKIEKCDFNDFDDFDNRQTMQQTYKQNNQFYEQDNRSTNRKKF